MESLLINFSETHRIISYLIIFFSIFIEGEVILLLAGVLGHKELLGIPQIITIASVAAIIHDLVYWSIGRRLAGSNKQKIWCFNLKKIRRVLEKLRGNNGLYIFVSKFAWNLNRIILISSDYLKIPLRVLLRYSLPASLIWSITLVSLGYFFASETDILKQGY